MAESDAAVTQIPAEDQEKAPVPEEAGAGPPEEPVAEPDEIPAVAAEHKRKLEVVEPCEEDEEAPAKKQAVSAELQAPESPEASSPPPAAATEPPLPEVAAADGVKQDDASSRVGEERVSSEPRHPDEETNGLAVDGVSELHKSEVSLMESGQLPSAEIAHHTTADNVQEPMQVVYQQDDLPTSGQPPVDIAVTSRKIEVPNNKVGVLIGKSGDTIKTLQNNSGAKIQITRDADADPSSATRPVELTGRLENINKAEKLIKDVIAEAEVGGLPSLVAKGYGTLQSGGEQLEIKVPNEKAGLIIGKGGETIKSLQATSGARIQLIPQHLPVGDLSKERVVRITGNKSQIDAASEMIMKVMNQTSTRLPPVSGGYNQQTFRPRGPTSQPQWGPHAVAPVQQPNDHQQRGGYPLQTSQYQPQSYGGYSQQPPPRSNFSSTGWDQRPVQGPPQTGHDYYGQGGHGTGTQSSTPAPVNYNYGQSQAPGYVHPTPMQQNYNEPRYYNTAPGQQMYGQQPVNSQPGVYGQSPSVPQAGYTQQPYGKPPYGSGPSHEAPQSYGPTRPDHMYQGPLQSSYGSGAPTQQSYPYGSGAPQTGSAYGQTYGPTSGTVDGYAQPPSTGYAQQGGQATSAYGQGGQPVPTYTQPGSQSAGYGQYPSAQPAYGDQPAQGNVNYGYQGGPADAGYGNTVLSVGYNAPPPVSNQPGSQQPTPNPSGYYDQSVPPQSGYANSVPGNGVQYDSAQMYGHH